MENIVAKGEIASFDQFLLLSLYNVFKTQSGAEASESVYMRERVKVKMVYTHNAMTCIS